MRTTKYKFHLPREYRHRKAPCLILFSCFLCVLFNCFSPFPSSVLAGIKDADTADSVSALKNGKSLLDSGAYGEALKSLESVYGRLPVVGDYILFFMATAYNNMEQFDESARRIEELLKTYPESPLRRKARLLQLSNILTVRQGQKLPENAFPVPSSAQKIEEVLRYLESYRTDYPEDAATNYFMAQLLKKSGSADRAKKLFIGIYIANNSFSELARRELQPPDISPEDMLAKASNLMKVSEYRKAEAILGQVLPFAKGDLREEVQRTLGLSLFRQKRYKAASEAFVKAGDIYDGARSLFRAGELTAFRETVSRLTSMDDKRAGSLLMAYASKKRRDGRTEEALQVFEDVRKKYPSLAEDALWGIAWTCYRNGDYRRASEVLTLLEERFPSSRYSYWRQRSAERSAVADGSNGTGAGSDKTTTGVSVTGTHDKKALPKDFYSVLAYVRESDIFSGRFVSRAAWTRPRRFPIENNQAVTEREKIPVEFLPSYERFAILMELGMREDAAAELVRLSNRISQPDLLLSLCRTLQEIGSYKRSINLLSRFSEKRWQRQADSSDVTDILYPLAYWPTVNEISERFAVDPFILLAVIREESRFDPYARSVAGALGLMQIMPHTAFNLDDRLKLEIADVSEIYNVRTNITVGAYYLNSLLKEFGSLPVALAAYNAGSDKAREWVRKGNYASIDEFIEDIPYDETRNYVKRVLLTYVTYMSLGSGRG